MSHLGEALNFIYEGNTCMILPINTNPPMRSYVHHCFTTAILTSEINTGESYYLFAFNDDLEYYNKIRNNIEFNFTKDKIDVRGKSPYNNMEGYLYANIKVNKEYILRLDYQQYICPNATIGMFLTSNTVIDIGFTPDFIFGFFSRDGLYSIYQGKKDFYGRDKYYETEKVRSKVFPVYMKLILENDTISISSSYDGIGWELLNEFRYTHNDNIKLGIKVYAETHEFYNWYYTNYIQIFCDFKRGVPIDYFMFLMKNSVPKYYHIFLDFNRVEKTIIDNLKIDIIDYIKTNINEYNYVLLSLNEFYIPGRDAYNRYDRYHDNLIYGYDENSLYIMGYGKYGIPITGEIAYSEIKKAYEYCRLDVVVALKHNTCNHSIYELNIVKIINSLTEYINGTDSSKVDSCQFMTLKDRIFGINIYDYILENIDYVLKDIRVFFFLSEHKQFMVERIKYFAAKQILQKNNTQELLNNSIKIYETTTTTRNLILKYMENLNVKNIKERIIDYTTQIKNMEKENILRLINELNCYIKSK